DDSEALINPLAEEICNGQDDDCDGVVDADAAEICTPSNVRAWFVSVGMVGTSTNYTVSAGIGLPEPAGSQGPLEAGHSVQTGLFPVLLMFQ
ncbi:MAG: putative metal-binding motif-containing protein, partial [Deltaproteobacteria bacterium]|nr:putative metal-binding motif-containing protein [Deltaproteobacteria bacterium]